MTLVNIMSGFKKSGMYPLNPGAVGDRQIVFAESVPMSHCSAESSTVEDTSSTFSHEEHALYET